MAQIVFAQGETGDASLRRDYGERFASVPARATARKWFLNVMKPAIHSVRFALLTGTKKPPLRVPGTVTTDDHHAGAFSRFVAARAHACNPFAAASLSAHSLDKRLGGRLRIACSAGAATASTIEFGQAARHDTKSGIQLIYFAGRSGALPGAFQASRQPAPSKWENERMGILVAAR